MAVPALAGPVLCLAARRRPGAWLAVAARTLALLLLLNEISWWAITAIQGRWNLSSSLPLQVCDTAALLAAAALWWRRPLLVELTYFWGIAGTMQALITPDLREHFPSYWYFQFYISHAGVVVAALFLIIGLRLRPRPGAVLRVFGLTVAFTALAGLTDWFTGGNYMYLRRPPLNGSLLNLIGPWPWYIASGAALAAVLLLLLDAPFRLHHSTPCVEPR